MNRLVAEIRAVKAPKLARAFRLADYVGRRSPEQSSLGMALGPAPSMSLSSHVLVQR